MILNHTPQLATPPPRLVAGAALVVSLLAVCPSTRAQCAPGWSALPPQVGTPLALEVHDEGLGPALFVGGHLISAGGHPVNKIARWDGRSWSALGEGLEPSTAVVHALYGSNTGPLDNIYAGGLFQEAGGSPASNMAQWNGRN